MLLANTEYFTTRDNPFDEEGFAILHLKTNYRLGWLNYSIHHGRVCPEVDFSGVSGRECQTVLAASFRQLVRRRRLLAAVEESESRID